MLAHPPGLQEDRVSRDANLELVDSSGIRRIPSKSEISLIFNPAVRRSGPQEPASVMSDSTELERSNAHASTMAEASRLMKRGLGLLAGAPAPETVAEAVDCFDRALDLRRRLPLQEFPVLRYDLAACLLNRAEAIVRFGDAAQIALAVGDYDDAIALLESLPLADDARFPRRLAIAHQNRGLALQALGGASHIVVWAFVDAIAVLEHADAGQVEDRDYLLAAATVNLAKALLLEGTPVAGVLARQAVVRALGLVKDLEEESADAAQVGLTGRHLLCRIIAAGGLADPARAGAVEEDVHEATDVADEALDLVRRWERRGPTRFRAIASDLFRFGAHVYAIYQPQFLAEFVADQLDPGRSSAGYVDSAEMRAAAEDVLRRVGLPESQST
jgi:tetratricopeptide (TPR) repeat protein